ncbi:MAG: hypothetical protein RMM06_09580 [Armatimonadota bacterium]|nr:hypothetical protein [Armatimonadota bacterium]
MRLRREWIHEHIQEQMSLVETAWLPAHSRYAPIANVVAVTLVVGLLLFFSADSAKVPSYVVGFVTTLILFILMGSAVLYLVQRAAAASLPHALEHLVASMPLSAGERSYVQLLLALADAETISESAARDLLSQANALLDQLLQLGEYEHRLRGMAGTASEDDLHRLRERLRETTDPVARDALQQSLQILRERLQQREQIEAHLQRAAALQELILQTLDSLRESLVRSAMLPCSLEEVDVGALYRRLTEVRSETRAIEQALQELQEVGRSTV